MKKISKLRGMQDSDPIQTNKFNFVENCFNSLANAYGYKEVRFPIVESTELFKRSVGDETDIVNKEMFTFDSKSGKSMTLRPEGTAGCMRMAIETGLLDSGQQRLSYKGPMFRYERPQKGRTRQFQQLSLEAYGFNDYSIDLEMLEISNLIFNELSLKEKISLEINSIGSQQDQKEYSKILKDYFGKYKKDLDKDSIERLEKNPLRILDSKNEEDIEISKSSPKIYDYLTKEAKKHFEDLKISLNLLEIDFEENANLVRGLDYYCNTVFEYKSENLGSQDTLLGGGRYDGLIKVLGGPDIPGIGWAAGIERIALLMEFEKKINSTVHIAVTNEKFTDYFLYLQKYLFKNRISHYWNYKYNLKKSFTKANSSSASYIIIIGENEFNGNFFTIKNLMTGEQKELKLNQIFDHFNDKSR